MPMNGEKIKYEIDLSWNSTHNVDDVRREIKRSIEGLSSKIKVANPRKNKELLTVKFNVKDEGEILSKEKLEEILHPSKISRFLIVRAKTYESAFALLSFFVYVYLLSVFNLISLHLRLDGLPAIYSSLLMPFAFGILVAFAIFAAFKYTGWPSTTTELLDSYGVDDRIYKKLFINNIERNAMRLLRASKEVHDPRLGFFITVSAFEEASKFIVERLMYGLKNPLTDKELADLNTHMYIDHFWKYRAGMLAISLLDVHNLDVAITDGKISQIKREARIMSALRDSYLSNNRLSLKYTTGEYLKQEQYLYSATKRLLKKYPKLVNRRDIKTILLYMSRLGGDRPLKTAG